MPNEQHFFPQICILYLSVIKFEDGKLGFYSKEYVEEVICKCLENNAIIPYQLSLSLLVFLITVSGTHIHHSIF